MSDADPGYLIGLIGSGIGPSMSPAVHEREAAALGLRYLYRRLELDRDADAAAATAEIFSAARASGFDGLNITHPSKQVVMGLLDDLSDDATALGAVNTVVFTDGRAIGHNTDWSGFAHSFGRGLPGAALRRVVLLGAGGAGAAVGFAMLTLGTQRLVIIDADADRAIGLATSLGARFGADRATASPLSAVAAELTGADGLVHATPTGMAAHPGLPVPGGLLKPPLWVADVVYRPLETELVGTARAAGCRVLNGGTMFVFQAVDAFRLFTGVEPDPDRMLAHFTEMAAVEGVAHAVET